MSQPRLTVDLGALASNWRRLAAAAAASGCTESAAVVKADAYGLGVEPVARTLAAIGCRRFFVATVQEGVALRDILAAGPSCAIHVLAGPTDPATASTLATTGLVPALNDRHQLELWKPHRHLPAAIHIDTGMNRLGFPFASLDTAAFQGYEVALVMSHFACADTPDHPLNAIQRSRCERLAEMFPGIPTSFTNSAAACAETLAPETEGGDCARLGIGLYGGNPFATRPSPVIPVATLDAPVLSVRHAAGGETVGYGATHALARRTTLAIVAAGYADGIPRSLSGQGVVGCKDHRLRVLGRISMDTFTIDATPIQDTVRPGDRVEVFGRQVALDEAASLAGTIAYELLTRIGPRVERR